MIGVATRLADFRPRRLRRTRSMGFDGRVLAHVGERAPSDRVIARGRPKTAPVIVGAARQLGIEGLALSRFLQCRPGDSVAVDEVLASRGGPLGVGARVARSPVTGVVQGWLEDTGEIVLIPASDEEDLFALIPGTVVGTVPRRGVTLETTAIQLECLLGLGKPTVGAIQVIGETADHILDASDIKSDLAGCLVVSGGLAPQAVDAARQAGVSGIVVGSVSAGDWRMLRQHAGLPSVIVLEGFVGGMSQFVWNGFRSHQGAFAILDPARQHPEAHWPEVLIPLEVHSGTSVREPMLRPGSLVRLSGAGFESRIAEVSRVGRFPRLLANGLDHPWVEVLVDGRREVVSQRSIELMCEHP